MRVFFFLFCLTLSSFILENAESKRVQQVQQKPPGFFKRVGSMIFNRKPKVPQASYRPTITRARGSTIAYPRYPRPSLATSNEAFIPNHKSSNRGMVSFFFKLDLSLALVEWMKQTCTF